MAGVSDFIQMATSKLGIPAGAAQSGAGSLLNLVKTQAGGDLFGKLGTVLPDAEKLASAAPAAPAAGGVGGMLGGLAAKAGGLLGGSGGAALGILGKLQSVGIPADKAAGFATQFVSFLKSKLPPDLLSGILSKVGDLKKLAG